MPPIPPLNQKLLAAAWQRQKTYSENATRYQVRFALIRTTILVLGVLLVIFSILESSDLQSSIIDTVLLALPITITALLAFAVRFDRGQNWVLLRATAETLKQEIYYYRTGMGEYSEQRNAILAKRIEEISKNLKGSPVHQGAFAPFEEEVEPKLIPQSPSHTPQESATRETNPQKPKSAARQDDLYSDLNNPQDYLEFRLSKQFTWYRKKAKNLAFQMQVFQAGIYILGAIGTFLAASANYKSWVAVTASFTGAFTNYLEFKRVEESLVGYNQAADALYDIRTWWYSLPTAKQNRQSFKKLVETCEGTIRSENTSWLQDMQERLAGLYEDDDNFAEADNKTEQTQPSREQANRKKTAQPSTPEAKLPDKAAQPPTPEAKPPGK